MKRTADKLKSNLGNAIICISPTVLSGIRAYRRKQWSRAQAYFERACEKHPRNSWAHFKLGMCHFKKKDWEIAATSMAKALELNPNQIRWRLQYIDALSKQAIRNKEWLVASARIQKLIELNIKNGAKVNARTYWLLSTILRKQGKIRETFEALKTATTLDPNNAEWWYELGEAGEVMKKFESAATSFKEAIRLKGKEADAYWHYREGYCWGEKCDEGPTNAAASELAYAQAIAKDTKLNSKRFGIGVFHQRRGYWVVAAREYAKQLRHRFLDAELHYRLGMAYDRCYEWNEAEECYKRALRLDRNQPRWHFRLGLALERQDKYKEAALAYKYATINQNEHIPYWFYRWGYVLEREGHHLAAAKAYLQTRLQQTLDNSKEEPHSEKTLLNDTIGERVHLPEQANAGNTKSLELHEAQFFGQELISWIKTLLDEDKTKPETWYELGNIYAMEECWQEASEAYQEAIARNNEHTPEWFYRLGFVFVQLGEYQKACQTFSQLEVQQEFYGVSISSQKTERTLLNTHYLNASQKQELKNVVLFESFGGASFTCNPYAIFLRLWKDPQFKSWTFVIVINEAKKIPDHFKRASNFVPVTKNSYLYTHYLATARILVNNATFPVYFTKKKGQVYINTWHGTPWKTLGNDNPLQNGNTARNFIHADCLLSPNEHTSDILIKRYGIDGLFQGELLESGYPRIDLLIKATRGSKQKLKERLRLVDEKPIVLFAPTYRGFWKNPEVEANLLIKTVNAIKSPDYHLIFRGHYFTEEKIRALELDITIADHGIDSCELLSVVDVLISDYSSIVFDFLVAKKPILLYIPDLDEYKRERGLYFEPNQVPGQPVETLSELKSEIQEAMKRPKVKTDSLEQYLPIYAPHEDGSATDRVIDKIKLLLNKSVMCTNQTANSLARRILLYPGTIQCLKDVEKLEEYVSKSLCATDEIVFIFNNEELVQNRDVYKAVESIPNSKAYIEYSGSPTENEDERWLTSKHRKHGFNPSKQTDTILASVYEREYKRIFGINKFTDIISLDSNDCLWNNAKRFNAHQI